jgi:hypothetical protein
MPTVYALAPKTSTPNFRAFHKSFRNLKPVSNNRTPKAGSAFRPEHFFLDNSAIQKLQKNAGECKNHQRRYTAEELGC